MPTLRSALATTLVDQLTTVRNWIMKKTNRSLLASAIGLLALNLPAMAQGQAGKPNILFIVGDDIGIMQPSIYHRGLTVDERHTIEWVGSDGARFRDCYAW